MRLDIYLAGQYERRDEFREYAHELLAQGYNVTSRWLFNEQDMRLASPSEIKLFAKTDLDDVARSNVLIAFTEPENAGGTSTRGGRHVEFGYALNLDMEILIVGPRRENVFHYLIGDRRIYDKFASKLLHELAELAKRNHI